MKWEADLGWPCTCSLRAVTEGCCGRLPALMVGWSGVQSLTFIDPGADMCRVKALAEEGPQGWGHSPLGFLEPLRAPQGQGSDPQA